MTSHTRITLSVLLLAAAAIAPTRADAQQTERLVTPYQHVVSANPVGLLIDWFNAEYERRITTVSTVGIGGSYMGLDDDDNDDNPPDVPGFDQPVDADQGLNLDLFWRFYPQGQPFERFAFSTKVGVTDMNGTFYPGFGFDANYSWLLGKSQNFYVGIGFGVKRLIGFDPDYSEDKYVFTNRLVNIGFAF